MKVIQTDISLLLPVKCGDTLNALLAADCLLLNCTWAIKKGPDAWLTRVHQILKYYYILSDFYRIFIFTHALNITGSSNTYQYIAAPILFNTYIFFYPYSAYVKHYMSIYFSHLVFSLIWSVTALINYWMVIASPR